MQTIAKTKFLKNLVYTVITSTISTNDSLILNNQLDVLHMQQPTLFNESKIILADTAYNSSILRNNVKDLKLGKLLTPKNIINEINLWYIIIKKE